MKGDIGEPAVALPVDMEPVRQVEPPGTLSLQHGASTGLQRQYSGLRDRTLGDPLVMLAAVEGPEGKVRVMLENGPLPARYNVMPMQLDLSVSMSTVAKQLRLNAFKSQY